jgi:HlyD family secretion protein
MPEKSSGGWGKWILIVVALALVAGGYFYFHRDHAERLSYNTTSVARSEVTQTVTATGTLNPVVNVTVGSQVSGRISKLNVDFNSTVKQGEVIAEIDPSTYQASVEQATADLANAKANLELQEVQYQRSADLFTNKLISGSDFDTARATLHEAEATVKIKTASLNNAEVNLNYCKIVSPVDGVVISRAVELGQTVASSFNTPTIFQIANDLTKMQIDAAVDEADIGGVKEGQSVDFTVDAYPSRTFTGVVTQVRNAPTAVNNVVTYDTVIGVTNADLSLKPGMTASVSIIAAQHSDVLVIPNSALRFQPPETALLETNAVAMAGAGNTGTNNSEAAGGHQGRRGGRGGHKPGGPAATHTVYLLIKGEAGNPDRLKPVEVKTSITDNINTEVLSGLKEGDLVVTGQAIPGMAADEGTKNPFSSSHHHF